MLAINERQLSVFKERLTWVMVAALLLTYLYCTTVDLTHVQQGILSWGLLGALLIMSHSKQLSSRLSFRIIFLLVAAFITLRYLVWRASSTLVYTGPVDFFFMSLLYVAELEVALVYLINMFTNIYPLSRKSVSMPEDQSTWPTVDVFLPTYTEDVDLVRITASAAKQIDYPADKINVYILDDGSTEQRRNNKDLAAGANYRYQRMKALADSIGVHYIARKENKHAKAGNINYAMERTHGDIILVLDCDHVPCHDILKNTLGWFFKDPKLCLVQTPHFFYKP